MRCQAATLSSWNGSGDPEGFGGWLVAGIAYSGHLGNQIERVAGNANGEPWQMELNRRTSLQESSLGSEMHIFAADRIDAVLDCDRGRV